ncbi:MAG TPA: hypothetical protein VIR59_07095 [Gaiellaceae bacterium]
MQGRLVHAAQFVGVKRSTTVKLAVLPFAGMLALALATPAHADDQTAPPPLMIAKTAAIAPDEPDATMPDAAAIAETATPPPAPTPEPAPVRVVAASGWELAAKTPVVHRPAPARTPVPTARVAPAPVISAPARPARAAQPHHPAERPHAAAPRATPRWYQLSPRQYRHAQADRHSSQTQAAAATPAKAALGAPGPAPAQPQKARAICELRLGKCLQICSWNAMHNGSQNERWIGACISSYEPVEKLDKAHELLLQRLWSIALDVRNAASGRQYQCFAPQYQSGTCAAARSSHPAARIRPQMRPQTTLASAHAAPLRSLTHVTFRHHRLPAAAAVTRAVRSATTVVRRPHVSREVAPAEEAGGAGASADWLLRALVALVAVAMIALLLAASSQLPAAGTAVSGMRTRLGSKGLSTSRIDLGRERSASPPRGKGIPYRD